MTVAEEQKNGTKRDDRTEVKTLDDEQQKQIISAAKIYRKHGYNQIKILPDGEKFEGYNPKTKRYEKKTADGRSAKGIGSWTCWQNKKQDKDRFSLENYFTHDREGKYPYNIGLIQGDISGDEEYGRFGIDADGKYVEIVEEAILALNNDELAEKIRNTPQTKTPDGYHWLLAYRKKDYGLQVLKSSDIHKGEKDKHEEIKLIADRKYMIEAPSTRKDGSYVAVKNDFDKIAKLTKEEVDKFIDTILLVIQEQQPEKEPTWAEEKESEENESTNNNTDVDVLVTIGKKMYVDGSRHDFAFGYACFMRRYLEMDREKIHQVIEALDPNDQKNWNTVEDILKQPKHKIMNRSTFRNLIAKITHDERQANNLINELNNYAPAQETRAINKGKEPSARLLDLALENTKLCFKDQDENYFAIIRDEINEAFEILNLDSDEFDRVLSGLYRNDLNGMELARKDWKNQVKENLKQIVDEKIKADEQKFKKTLYDRMVWVGDTYYYNLNNLKGEIVKITKDAISIVKQSPELILFKKISDDHEQVLPDFDLENTTDYLDKFLDTFNFETEGESDEEREKNLLEHKLILKCYLSALVLNGASFPINYTTGNEGSNKTTFQRQVKSIVDPVENKCGARIEDKIMPLTTKLNLDPKDTWERFLVIHQNHFTCFDNVDEIPRDIYDELCLTVTGYNIPKRTHYKMEDLKKLTGRRPLALTSVTFSATKPDFLDRVIHSKVVPVENYKTEEQVWNEFNELKPKILGYIFTKIQEFLGKYEELKETIKPRTRLADFEVQCEVMSRCLGNGLNEFQNAWVRKKRNR